MIFGFAQELVGLSQKLQFLVRRNLFQKRAPRGRWEAPRKHRVLLISDGPSVLALWQISLTKGAYRKAARCLNTKAAGQFSANLPLPVKWNLWKMLRLQMMCLWNLFFAVPLDSTTWKSKLLSVISLTCSVVNSSIPGNFFIRQFLVVESSYQLSSQIFNMPQF